MTNNKIQVLYPSYYNDFKCKADKCRNTCCQGWKIYLTKKDYFQIKSAMIENEKSKFNASFIKSKGEDDSSYAMVKNSKEGLCPLINEDKLCTLHIEHGYELLPYICKTYPSENIKSGEILFKYLMPSCEVVVEQLFEIKNGIEFIQKEEDALDIKNQLKIGSILGENFIKVYDTMVDILQNRDYMINERLLFLGEALQNLNENIKNDDFKIDTWCEQYKYFIMDTEKFKVLNKIYSEKVLTIKNNISMIVKLKESAMLSKATRELIKNTLTNFDCGEELGSINIKIIIFDKYLEKYDNYFDDKEYFLENLLVTILPIFFKKGQYKNVWESYMAILMCYNVYKLILIGNCDKDFDDAIVADIISKVSRNTLNGKIMNVVVDLMKQIKHDTFWPVVNFIF